MLLKKEVIKVMTDSSFHPQWKSIFKENASFVKKCGENIKPFKRVYTINYDLILYWLLCNENRAMIETCV